MNIHTHGFGFMEPYIRSYCELVDDPREADFVLTMNNAGANHVVEEARQIAHAAEKPLCWWTIEDPNSLAGYMPQAKLADFVFTSDKACIPYYRRQCRHDRVFWLPLAACEELHHPLPLAEDAADFVFSGNWYPYQARKWGDEVVILPLARAGYSMAIFSYEEPPYPELKPFWRGGTSCYTVAEQYTHGKVVLGNNNQRTDMDGRGPTYMTSMRTYEALACGKVLIAPHSDAYEALGFKTKDYNLFSWHDCPDGVLDSARCYLDNTPRQTVDGKWYTAGELNRFGAGDTARRFVLAHHTYRHRLERITRALAGEAEAQSYE